MFKYDIGQCLLVSEVRTIGCTVIQIVGFEKLTKVKVTRSKIMVPGEKGLLSLSNVHMIYAGFIFGGE